MLPVPPLSVPDDGLLSRSQFFPESSSSVATAAATLVISSLVPDKEESAASKNLQNDSATAAVLSIPLIFLPRAGCLALCIRLENSEAQNDKTTINASMDTSPNVLEYYAVVDTGSPFLTAPRRALEYSQDASQLYPSTAEQYGESIGDMEWRESNVGVFQQLEQDNRNHKSSNRARTRNKGTTGSANSRSMILGVPPEAVLQDTGGIFCGLLAQDDARPTFLQQLGLSSFVLDWEKQCLLLGDDVDMDKDTPASVSALMDNSRAPSKTQALPLYNLSPYGPNLHHYAVLCSSVTFQFASNNGDNDEHSNNNGGSQTFRTGVNLQRPVVVVLDSGLTGCILSDSWLTEETFFSPDELPTLQGAVIELEGDKESPPLPSSSAVVTLSSQPAYWYLSCFRLPWFTSEDDHPHVIAAGTTFLNGCRMPVDTKMGRVSLTTPTVA